MDDARPKGRFRQMLAGMSAAEQARRRFLVMNFRVFVDDSGNGHPPVYVLAGFISTAEKWERFERDWQEQLDNPPKIEYFKMTEANALQGQFSKFKKEQRDQKLRSLMSVISEHAMAGLYAKADISDWQDILRRKIAPALNTPYVPLANELMEEIIHALDLEHEEYSIDFIFDEQRHLSDLLQANWTHFHNSLLPRRNRHVSRPQHQNNKNFPPLQAADLLAWHIRNWYAEREEGKPFSGPCNAPLDQFSYFFVQWDRRRMERYYSRLRSMIMKSGAVFLYDRQDIDNKITAASRQNKRALESAKPGDIIRLDPLPIPATSLYRLVGRCLHVGIPHLHTRWSGECCLAGTNCREPQS